MKLINKYRNYLIILMLIISGCKNKSKTEVSNEPDPNLRSFHFLVERSKVYSLLQLVFS